MNAKLLTSILFCCSCGVVPVVVDAGVDAGGSCSAVLNWNVDEYLANTTDEYSLRTKLTALSNKMKTAEADASVTISTNDLQSLYVVGSPSLKSLSSTGFQTQVEQYLTAFSGATGHTWTPAPLPMAPGGIYGKYIFTERGVDLRQSIEKGLFGAAHYLSAALIAAQPLTAKSIDRILALYGAHPSFPRDDKAAMNADAWSAVYGKRRNVPAEGSNGIYLRMAEALKKARSNAQGECVQEAQMAVSSFMRDWERVLVATAIYYLHAVIPVLEKANITESEKSETLHGLNECVAFLTGLQSAPAATRFISDAQLEAVLVLLKSKSGMPSEIYSFITDRAANVSALAEARTKLAEAEQFTPAEVENFKTNF